MSNFSCSLSRNITSHSMENLTLHFLLRWKMIIITNSHYLTYTFLIKKVGRMYVWNLGVKGLKTFQWYLWLRPRPHVPVCLKTQTFVCGLAFRPQVSDDCTYRNRKPLKTDTCEHWKNSCAATCGRRSLKTEKKFAFSNLSGYVDGAWISERRWTKTKTPSIKPVLRAIRQAGCPSWFITLIRLHAVSRAHLHRSSFPPRSSGRRHGHADRVGCCSWHQNAFPKRYGPDQVRSSFPRNPFRVASGGTAAVPFAWAPEELETGHSRCPIMG